MMLIITYYIISSVNFVFFSFISCIFYPVDRKNWKGERESTRKMFFKKSISIYFEKNDSCNGHGNTMHSIYCLFIRLHWCLHKCPMIIIEMKKKVYVYMDRVIQSATVIFLCIVLSGKWVIAIGFASWLNLKYFRIDKTDQNYWFWRKNYKFNVLNQFDHQNCWILLYRSFRL